LIGGAGTGQKKTSQPVHMIAKKNNLTSLIALNAFFNNLAPLVAIHNTSIASLPNMNRIIDNNDRSDP
jgi:hypothetical protein